MATLWIKEHETMPIISGNPQIWAEPVSVEQTVTVSGTSAQSAAFNAKTKFITITCDGIFSYLVSTNPTAATTNFRVEAGNVLTFAVPPAYKIAAITNT
jgi:hypothetical protein